MNLLFGFLSSNSVINKFFEPFEDMENTKEYIGIWIILLEKFNIGQIFVNHVCRYFGTCFFFVEDLSFPIWIYFYQISSYKFLYNLTLFGFSCKISWISSHNCWACVVFGFWLSLWFIKSCVDRLKPNLSFRVVTWL